MYKGKTIFAFIPARGGSKRIPGKNMRLLNGNPLIIYTMNAAAHSKYIDYYVLSTEDDTTKKYCENLLCNVIGRTPEQCDDSYSTDMLRNDMYKQFDYDYCITLHPTSPFRTADDIDKGIEMIIDADADSLLSVRDITRDWWQSLFIDRYDGLCYEEPNMRFWQTQDFDNFSRTYANAHFLTIWKWGKNKGKEIPFIITDRYKLIDIDNPIDFEFAEFVMKKQSIDKICDGEIERH